MFYAANRKILLYINLFFKYQKPDHKRTDFNNTNNNSQHGNNNIKKQS